MENISQMSLLEVAVQLMEEKAGERDINELIKAVLEAKGLEDEDGAYTTQLYVDITTSSKFVYMGENKWDLKIRQSLDQFDKDGSAFNSKEDEYREEEEDTLDDEILEDDEEEIEEDDDDSDEEEDDDDERDSDDEDEEDDDHEESTESDDDLDDDSDDIDLDDDFDEDKYDKYMDDYEDMYDEN